MSRTGCYIITSSRLNHATSHCLTMPPLSVKVELFVSSLNCWKEHYHHVVHFWLVLLFQLESLQLLFLLLQAWNTFFLLRCNVLFVVDNFLSATLGMLSFCWDSKFRCPILIWFSESATLVNVKQYKNFLPMIPKSYENEYSICLILTTFAIFLVWVTFRRLTLECCHSAGIPSSGALFWSDFRNLRHL